jgi:hypothetical protein
VISTTSLLPETRCPHSKTALSAVGSGGEGRPEAGSLTVCISCAEVRMFIDDLGLRCPEAGELAATYAAQPGLEMYLERARRAGRRLDRRSPFPPA